MAPPPEVQGGWIVTSGCEVVMGMIQPVNWEPYQVVNWEIRAEVWRSSRLRNDFSGYSCHQCGTFLWAFGLLLLNLHQTRLDWSQIIKSHYLYCLVGERERARKSERGKSESCEKYVWWLNRLSAQLDMGHVTPLCTRHRDTLSNRGAYLCCPPVAGPVV